MIRLWVELRPSLAQIRAVQVSKGGLEVLLPHIRLDGHHICGGGPRRGVKPRDCIVAHATKPDFCAVLDLEGSSILPGD